MSDIISDASIKVSIDAAGVEVGLRKVEEGAARTKRTLDTLGKSDGISKMGDGAEAAAAKFVFGSKGIIDSIEKRTAAMELGKRGTVEYYTALANQKGVNPAILQPYLDQLDAVTKKTEQAAIAQRKSDDGAQFLAGLQKRSEEIGKSASQLLEMQAAQLGVSESAAPLIERLRESEEAANGMGGALGITTGALVSFLAGLAGAVSLGGFVAAVNSAIDKLAELDDMAQKTGSKMENLSRFKKVAEATGQDFSKVDGALTKLARGMGGLDEDSNKAIDALKRLGISTKDLSNQDPSDVFLKVSTELQNYRDGARKTTLINDLLGKSGADLLPYMNDVAETFGKYKGTSDEAGKAASAFNDNINAVKTRFGEVATSLAVGLLPTLTRFSEYIVGLVESGEFQEWIDGAAAGFTRLVTAVESAATAFVPLAKIAGAFFLTFVAGPKLIGLATTALIGVYGAVGKVVTNFIAGTATTGIFNTALFGTGLAAQFASGWMGKLAIAGGVLVAAYAGIKIGTYLRENFVEARVAGLAFVGALMTGFEHVKFAAQVAWEAIAFSWDLSISGMKLIFAEYLSFVQKGFSVLKQDKLAADIGAYVNSLQKAATAQGSFSARIAGTKAAHEAELRAIEENITGMVAYELSMENAAKAKDKVSKTGGKDLPEPGAGGKGGKGKGGKEEAEEARRIATAYDEAVKAQADYAASLGKMVEDANKEAKAQEDLVATFGMSKTAIEALAITREEERANLIRSTEGAEDLAAALDMVNAARRRGNAYAMKLEGLEEGKKAGEALDKYLDPARAKDFGQALTDAFGSAGSALTKLTNLLGDYGRTQAEISEQRGNARLEFLSGQSTELEYSKKLAQLNDRQTKSQLGSYGQMTSAAASFFGEQSRGYKALQAASQVFHAAELAMTLAELVPKGIAAILGQGQGDPYTAFARMAAMTALVAGLGVAIGGGSSGAGGAKAEDVQKSQGAGGVFGDTGAQSASIRRSLDLIEKNTFQGLDYSAGMLSALRNIESAMGGVANILIGTPGVVNGENLNIQEGTIKRGSAGSVATGSAIGGALGSFFSPLGTIIGSTIGAAIGKLWGKTTQNVVDSGIKFGGSLDALQMGQGVSQYASVDTTKSSWFGLKKKTSNSVQTQAIGGELADQFGLIFTSLEETLKAAAVGMDLGADSVAASLSNLVIKTSTISLKGLQGDDLTAALNAVISQALDQVAAAAFPSFDAFRKVGEGYAETVVRVANNFQAINVVFESFGKVFGKVGLESIAARERLIEMSGGLEKFSAQGEYFLTNFFTPTEQSAALKKRIQPTLSQFGLSTEGADASKVFRDFVVGLDTTTAAGAEAYATLMKIAPAFNEIVKAGKDELEERRSLQDQLDNLTMSSAQLLKKQRDALMGSNRALFDQVQAATAAKAAQESAKSSLGDVISRMKSFGQSARSLRDGLTTGALSTLTPEQKYAESRKQYQVTLAAAKAGDADAQGKFSAMATAFLDASQKINGGDSMYAADFADVLKTSNEISRWADGQVDVAQASLKALNAQVEALGQLNATMLVIAGGGAGSIGALTPPPPRPFADGPNYAGMGTANTVPLVAEIKALRENNERMATELAGMRADQKQIAAASIEANAKVTLLAAKMGSEGMERAMVNQAWQEQNGKGKLR